jgi:hypothetical protein
VGHGAGKAGTARPVRTLIKLPDGQFRVPRD